MKNTNEKIKYILYARKSSEGEDRQVASIAAQIDELKKLAEKDGLEIVKMMSESYSAKEPGRPVFNEMLVKLNNGEAQGILCWKLNRLARNPIDGSKIQWALQQGTIKHIRAYERSYYPTDNVLMMAVEFGMANQFILDLSSDTRRGLKNKAERGWYPNGAPVGYTHNPLRTKGDKEIIKDPERFDFVRKMFDLMLTGAYRPPQILKIANEEWGFRMKNGKLLVPSTLYRMFASPFYCGLFEYPKGSGNWYKGAHKPLISEEEFDKIQVLLGRKGAPRPKRHMFAFTGMVRCAECGARITAEEKIKRQKNGNVHRYVYYHCTKRKNPNCRQRSIEKKEFEKQVVSEIEAIKIPQEFHNWALKWLKKENATQASSREQIYINQRRAYEGCVKKLGALIDMRANGELTEQEFRTKKSVLLKEKGRFKELLNDTDKRVDDWVKKADDLFGFARDAKAAFETGDLQKKKLILTALGSGFTLRNQTLNIELQKPLPDMEIAASEVRLIHKRLEPVKNGLTTEQIEDEYSKNRVLLPG